MRSNIERTAALVKAVLLMLMMGSVVMAKESGDRATKNQFKGPVKVFILPGQSNMQGCAHFRTLDAIEDESSIAPTLKRIKKEDGSYVVRDDVFLSYLRRDEHTKAPLTINQGCWTDGWMGPELMFGIEMGDFYRKSSPSGKENPVLLIKTCWGGQSLYGNFRPPSAGKPAFETGMAERKAATGVAYRMMIDHVNKVLGDIKRFVPKHDPEQGCEIAGFVWFQGFNDLVSAWTFEKNQEPGGYKLYSDLLAHFIRDVRNDLKAPKLPFIIGVMGIDGKKADRKPCSIKHLCEAQADVAFMREFKGNVIAVRSAPYWDEELQALQERMETGSPAVGAKVAEQKDESSENKMKHMAKNFKPSEWKMLQGASKQGYHYLGAAKIMAPIGGAFAESLIPFVKQPL